MKINNLTNEINGKILYQNVSFNIGNKDKIGLIGSNGARENFNVKSNILWFK